MSRMKCGAILRETAHRGGGRRHDFLMEVTPRRDKIIVIGLIMMMIVAAAAAAVIRRGGWGRVRMVGHDEPRRNHNRQKIYTAPNSSRRILLKAALKRCVR